MSGGGEHLRDEGERHQIVIAGAFAGLVSRFCIAPLDVLKIRLQLQVYPVAGLGPQLRSARRLHAGTISTFKSILLNEGITAFWKGNVPAELLYVTYGAAQFSIYRFANHTLKPLSLPNALESFLSGAVAGACATMLTYPLDLLRTRFAAQGTNRIYSSLRGSVRDIARAEGAKGFFQGLSAGVGQVMPYMGLFFATYETLRPSLAHLSLPWGSGDATAGLIAGVFAKTGVFPLDVIRKRLQVQGPMLGRFAGGMVPRYEKSIWNTGKSIRINEGWRGLYRGLGISLVKSAPASAITMWTYEHVLKILKAHDQLE